MPRFNFNPQPRLKAGMGKSRRFAPLPRTDVVIGQIPRTPMTHIAVALAHFLGEPRIDVRVYVGWREGEGAPTQKGISIRLAHLPLLLTLLERAQDETIRRGMLSPDAR